MSGAPLGLDYAGVEIVADKLLGVEFTPLLFSEIQTLELEYIRTTNELIK